MPHIFYLGDIHGEFTIVERLITRVLPDGNITIIQVGDFGAGFSRALDQAIYNFASFLEEKNIKMYAIRGNHDNPVYFTEENSEKFGPSLTLVPDYTVLELESARILCLGGAISIDRKFRNPGSSYWYDEIYDFQPQILDKIEGITTVVSHTGPSCGPVPPIHNAAILDFAIKDTHLIPDLVEEREKMDETAKILLENGKNSIKKWIFGHFHHSSSIAYQGTMFKVLDINEIYEV